MNATINLDKTLVSVVRLGDVPVNSFVQPIGGAITPLRIPYEDFVIYNRTYVKGMVIAHDPKADKTMLLRISSNQCSGSDTAYWADSNSGVILLHCTNLKDIEFKLELA